MKYSEGYLRPEEPSVVRFVRDFTRQKTQKHQRKALVCVSKTMKYSEGYLRPEEPSFVRSVPDFTRQNTQKHQRKAFVCVTMTMTITFSHTYVLQHQE
jgi:uncharacterized membrane protein YbaN (DUF454 family)